MSTNDQLLTIAVDTAKEAGIEVMRHYNSGDFTSEFKSDDSPVTSADIAANDIIMAALEKLTPDIPIISEEVGAKPLAERGKWSRYWLLDPIDGTGEFILKSGDFAVNIALIENGKPVIGVVHAPVHEVTYYGQKDVGAFKDDGKKIKQIYVKPYEKDRPVMVAISRRQKLSVMGQYLNTNVKYEYVARGSCSLKICLIAEGGADCYIRVGPTGEWDTGACQCILEQAGGTIVDGEHQVMSYNSRETLMNPDFMGVGSSGFSWQKIIQAHATLRQL
jgi:3'(2'), 5'-bisphosphate nucleotidase